MSVRSVLSVSILSTTLALAASALPAAAQQTGGLPVSLDKPSGPVGLARPLQTASTPYLTAQQMQNGTTPSDHQAMNQSMLSSLPGLQFGSTSMGAGRQQLPGPGSPWSRPHQLTGYGGTGARPHQLTGYGSTGARPQQPQTMSGGYRYGIQRGRGNGPLIINNDGSIAVTTGGRNVVQQSSVAGASGPVAQQQILGSKTGRAVNMAGSTPN